MLDHANNAVAWAIVEQLRARALWHRRRGRGAARPTRSARPFRAEVEFRDAIERSAVEGDEPLIVAHALTDGAHRLTVWSADGGVVHLTALVQPLGASTRP